MIYEHIACLLRRHVQRHCRQNHSGRSRKKGIDINVKSVGASELGDELKAGWDAVLVAPQVRHRLKDFEAEAAEYKTPVALIPPQAYTPLGGPAVLAQILQLVK